MAATMLASWIKDQKVKGPLMKDAPTFYRNLEEALDVRRADHAMFTKNKSAWKQGLAADFCSNDLLSLGSSGMMRKAFLEELAANPDFSLYSGGSRLMDGNYDYIENVEQEVADFHHAETALIVGSGYEANVAIFSAIPRPGDVIVFDELVHASSHDGMVHSLALTKLPFRHNDLESFRDVLTNIVDTHSAIKDATRSVLISVETVYSMDGDLCPIEEMLEIAREVCPKGNTAFIVDEAHATGILGPNGGGLLMALGLEKEKEIAIRLHTCGKGLASTGAVILGSSSVRFALTNFARSVIYTTAPTFPTVAAIRAGYNLLKSGATKKPRDHIQHLVKHFFTVIKANPVWDQANEMGILSIPLSEDWESRETFVHIVPVWTRQLYNFWLFFHLQLSNYCTFPIGYPTVPKGHGRIRLMFHGRNTGSEVEGLAAAICTWAQEMIDIEQGKSTSKIPKAAQQVYALMANV